MVLCFNLLIVWVWPRISGFEVWHATCWVFKNRETRVFRNSVDAFYCVLTKEDLCNLCMQQVLPYLETSIPKCSLVCRCFLWWLPKRGSDFSRQEKRWTNCGGSEAEIQNWILPTEEGTRATTVPLVPVLLTWFGNKFHFLHFFVDGPKSCPQIW